MTELAMTESIGAGLKAAREARGLSISEVAQQLKFAPRQLEALEQERFDLLPGGTFVRGMVRSYARLLKLERSMMIEAEGSARARAAARGDRRPLPGPRCQ